MALDTVADYITDARTLLQDKVQPYRYDDASLITALNTTMLDTLRLRPDLFPLGVPSFTTDDITDDTLVQVEEPFRLAVEHGLMAHALTRDQEDIQDQKAATFFATFNYMLTGSPTPSPAKGK